MSATEGEKRAPTRREKFGIRGPFDETGLLLPHVTQKPDYPKLDRPEYPRPAFLRYRLNGFGGWDISVTFGGRPRELPKEQQEFYSGETELPNCVETWPTKDHCKIVSLFGEDGSPNFAAIRAAFPPPADREPG